MKALVLGQKIWVKTWSRKRNSKLNYKEGVRFQYIGISYQSEWRRKVRNFIKNNISSYSTYNFWAQWWHSQGRNIWVLGAMLIIRVFELGYDKYDFNGTWFPVNDIYWQTSLRIFLRSGLYTIVGRRVWPKQIIHVACALSCDNKGNNVLFGWDKRYQHNFVLLEIITHRKNALSSHFSAISFGTRREILLIQLLTSL